METTYLAPRAVFERALGFSQACHARIAQCIHQGPEERTPPSRHPNHDCLARNAGIDARHARLARSLRGTGRSEKPFDFLSAKRTVAHGQRAFSAAFGNEYTPHKAVSRDTRDSHAGWRNQPRAESISALREALHGSE